ncbi:TonB-dependent receptor plug domain-containing protein [Patiriisocius hiemis]|uniref:TonB-dependent receptor plug domain-containing protein n=1 Tax=Patiriisocius hiemis TaxID=3075604 RepID=A0ABU2YD30_9FLAO|nr:TonB-dependent receptor plug domain-containing protein [Constantimarinum sp. W242]MDT0556087.1 TonB-dependent receptor plug domain-containing protein [Constantimarinum sp. W242]
MTKSKNSCKTLIVVIFFFFLGNIQAQEKTLLTTVLQSLEERFDISFSFSEDLIKGKEVVVPSNSLTLEEALKYLDNVTDLFFNRINQRYISVIPKKNVPLCGQLISMEDNLPLSGATIQGDDVSSVISDLNGVFYINSSSTAPITIQFLGYETLTITAKSLSQNCPTIYLVPQLNELSPVLINTIFTKGISKNNNGSFRINTGTFGLLPGQVENDILQIVQALPSVESSDETISNLNIRGGTNAENLILWEDIKMYQNGHFFGLISAFDPNITKEVSVYKNGAPARYGESVSGVIAMSTSNPENSDFSGGAGFNLINGNAFLQIPISEKVKMSFAGRKSLTEIIETPTYDTYASRIFQDTKITTTTNNNLEIDGNVDFSFYDFSTTTHWKVSEKDHIKINALAIQNDLEYIETIVNTSNSETSQLNQSNLVGGISWNRDWSSSLSSYVMGFATYYQLNAENQDIFTTQVSLQENEVLETGLRAELKKQFSEKLHLNAGYHFTETGISNTQDVNIPRFRDFEKEVLRTHSVFSSATFQKQKTRVQLGVRANYFSKFNRTILEPRFQLRQELSSHFVIELLGEFKSQATSQRIDFESDFLGIEKRRWILANEETIPIITSKQASLQLEYKKNGWLLSTEGFYKKVDGISSRTQGFQNQFQFVNATGAYQVRGLEVIINKKTKNLSSWLSYKYAVNNYSFDEFQPSTFPNNLDIRHNITLATSYTLNKFKISSGVNWRTGIPFTQALDIQDNENGTKSIIYDTPNNSRLEDYIRLDFSGEYVWDISKYTKAKINVALLNVLNKQNILNRRFAILEDENGESQINTIEETSLGVTPNISIQVLF